MHVDCEEKYELAGWEMRVEGRDGFQACETVRDCKSNVLQMIGGALYMCLRVSSGGRWESRQEEPNESYKRMMMRYVQTQHKLEIKSYDE